MIVPRQGGKKWRKIAKLGCQQWEEPDGSKDCPYDWKCESCPVVVEQEKAEASLRFTSRRNK